MKSLIDAAVDGDVVQRQRVVAVDLDGGAARRYRRNEVPVTVVPSSVSVTLPPERHLAVVQVGIADRAGAGDVDIAGDDAAAGSRW